MKQEYTPLCLIRSSRFIRIWEPAPDEFKNWTLARVGELVADNGEICHKETFGHMSNLFTSIAVHEWDLSHGMSEGESLDRISRTMEEFMLPTKLKYRKLLSNRCIFNIIAPFIPKKMAAANGKGFAIVPVKVKGGCGFDAIECPFSTIMRKYGHIELGKRFCAIDDYMYGDIPGVNFTRTGTLCRGCDRCDFRFTRK